MARVAQIGAVETNATYNRALIKSHVPIKLSDASPEAFELGQQPELVSATMLKTDLQISFASRCIAQECAMWRWEHTTASVPVENENGATTYKQKTVKTHGYCGLSPLAI
jgi:hypothetical protein